MVLGAASVKVDHAQANEIIKIMLTHTLHFEYMLWMLYSASAEPGVSTVSHDHSNEVKQTLRTTCSRCHGFGEVPKKGSACPRQDNGLTTLAFCRYDI